VTVRLRETPTTLLMVDGAAYRIGQVGAYVRIPVGYTQLYGVCTQVGADPLAYDEETDPSILERPTEIRMSGYRWMKIALFGESAEGRFERGVGQYPTVGDEVHVVTRTDLDVIYTDRGDPQDAITIGRIAGSDGIPASLRVSALVSRHASVVGSTGAGKSNLVAILLRALGTGPYASARVLVIDPHGEYGSALPDHTRLISGTPADKQDMLRVPYWALSFDELVAVTMGSLRDTDAEHIRERVRESKMEAAERLATKPPAQAITADSPVPFSLRRLWFELENNERMTFRSPSDQRDETREKPIEEGDAQNLIPPRYPAASGMNKPPHRHKSVRGIGRQLELMRTRMLDSRFNFMLNSDDDWSPDEDGDVKADLDSLLARWIGSERPITSSTCPRSPRAFSMS
jgi:uncharacterized protein